jgi:hypothetical protein
MNDITVILKLLGTVNKFRNPDIDCNRVLLLISKSQLVQVGIPGSDDKPLKPDTLINCGLLSMAILATKPVWYSRLVKLLKPMIPTFPCSATTTRIEEEKWNDSYHQWIVTEDCS